MKPIGVLSLQGNFAAHSAKCATLGMPVCEIRNVAQLNEISALIIPGGESSALLRLMAPSHFLTAIRQFYVAGGAIMGTCAGLIMLSCHINPDQESLQLLDIEVKRNAYGRQLDSFVAQGQAFEREIPMVFIRAPKITRCGSAVEVLARCGDEVVMVAQQRLLGCSFHPEMTEDLSVHEYFIERMVRV